MLLISTQRSGFMARRLISRSFMARKNEAVLSKLPADAIKLVMVSFDSTIAANLSVGLPLDLLVMEKDKFEPLHERRILASDPYYQSVSRAWGDAMLGALESLPPYSLDGH